MNTSATPGGTPMGTATGITEVVVIGGGYAGVMAANRLTQREDVTVTLVNPRPEFVERIRLHQLVAGTHAAVADYAKVLSPRVSLLVDSVTRIDAADRSVALAAGSTLRYDYLVYAVGSSATGADVPGVAEFGYPIATMEHARRLKAALEDLPKSFAVTVVGAGPAGIETAAELAEQGRAVTLVTGGALGPSLHEKGRAFVARKLVKLGVTVIDGPGSMVTAVERDGVRLADGRELASALTVWAAGFSVPDLALRSGLSTDAAGRLLTDETLTSVDDVRIIAAGDSAAPSGMPLRMGCQSAVQLGPQAAETVLARLAGRDPAEIDVGFVGLCVSLGRSVGIFQVLHKDDSPRSMYIGGRFGGRIKEFICKGTVWQLKTEGRKPGKHTWWSKDAQRRAKVEALHGKVLTSR
ncbi:FAD-dependent pyridine nucleotide-disulphide oxidoreductase [Catenulispora acidiphila DSM 44928]|uniref:FAD-dependent pyridine nucleotide-disulphide oxidoreductase n=1 Tax=Catenulispora acidiphila (strain DSM 44928 / JCM 14897 / NBRC 102108 / NRRL B-24433 / ID139908) TaxID=479433 RepID=C7Q6U0_CATAD|nr:FAD-dependent oxidoreductase [Catenulispora acidiphila]ACU75953.1 FAD-dependent pyridine nucleotide-disulphide oxidoreductase [Catenulispora acidiphila DSM 44928]